VAIPRRRRSAQLRYPLEELDSRIVNEILAPVTPRVPQFSRKFTVDIVKITAAPWLRTSPLELTVVLSRETPIDLAQAQDQLGRRVGAGRGSNKHDARFCLRRT
jgi:hypothetical protein